MCGGAYWRPLGSGLSLSLCHRCTFVFDYPRAIKSFYMRDNADGETVAAMDLLVPGVGELVGGSQREERLDKLEAKMRASNLDLEDYWWYVRAFAEGCRRRGGVGLWREVPESVPARACG